MLDGGYGAGISVDGFIQVEECAVELASVAEGGAWAGASIAEQMCMLPGA